MLASTVKFLTNKQPPPPPPPQPPGNPPGGTTARPALQQRKPPATPPAGGAPGPAPSEPNSVPTNPHRHQPTLHAPAPEGTTAVLAGRPQPDIRTGQRSTLEHHPDNPRRIGVTHRLRSGMALHHQPAAGGEVLLRKEVIQPHLPVRLPCYDFVPIADPAFDGSLPQGVGPPASGVTDFRDVTGGVYKARERIHRSVADLRLLATPTSWGRVADPNPN